MTFHGESEMKRLPLDSLVLDLKSMLGGSPIVPILAVSSCHKACMQRGVKGELLPPKVFDVIHVSRYIACFFVVFPYCFLTYDNVDIRCQKILTSPGILRRYE